MTSEPRPKPVYAIICSDRYLRRQAAEELLARLSSGDDSLGAVQFRGTDAELADVLDEARTPSLLGGSRIVVVDDADEFITAHREALERYCSSPADTASLVLVCQSMPKTTRIYRILAKTGEIMAIEAPEPRDMAAWIVRRAQQAYGKAIASRAAGRLRELVGNAPGLLDAELAKLATYVGDRREINEHDIAELTGHLREEMVFAVLDAMVEGRMADAMAQWESVVATDRAGPAKAVAGLASGVRRLLKAKLDFDAGANIYGVAKVVFADPRTAERRLRAVTVNRLIDMQRDLLSADLAVKTGGSSAETAVETFIIKHCTRVGEARVRVG